MGGGRGGRGKGGEVVGASLLMWTAACDWMDDCTRSGCRSYEYI